MSWGWHDHVCPACGQPWSHQDIGCRDGVEQPCEDCEYKRVPWAFGPISKLGEEQP